MLISLKLTVVIILKISSLEYIHLLFEQSPSHQPLSSFKIEKNRFFFESMMLMPLHHYVQ